MRCSCDDDNEPDVTTTLLFRLWPRLLVLSVPKENASPASILMAALNSAVTEMYFTVDIVALLMGVVAPQPASASFLAGSSGG